MKIQALITIFHFFRILIAMPVGTIRPTSLQADAMRRVAAFHEVVDLQTLDANDNSTEEGLSGPCRPVTMIFAKGTGENGNVGDGHSPGPAWFTEIRKSLGQEGVTIQGVQYTADLGGYLMGGDQEGSERFLNLTNSAVTKCPNTKIVIGGYSQGAQLAHNAADKFSPDVTSKVAAAVLFGDPLKTQSLGNVPAAKVMNICHDGDMICGQFGGAGAHLTYSQDASEAASFVTKMVK